MFARENGRWEEWSALHQRRRGWAKPSGPFSALAPASSLQPPGGTSTPPWPSKLGFPRFSKATSHFCHESGAEEWPALRHWCGQDQAKPVGPISAPARASLPRSDRRSGVVSLVVKVETSLVLKGNFAFAVNKRGGSGRHSTAADQTG